FYVFSVRFYALRHLHSFPTRRSSDLSAILYWFYDELLDWDENFYYTQDGAASFDISDDGRVFTFTIRDDVNWHDGKPVTAEDWEDRKSTRLNSSHVSISYAVFCLKKK